MSEPNREAAELATATRIIARQSARISDLEAECDALRAALGKSQRFLQSVRHVFDHSGAMNATQLARRDYYLATLDALREKGEGGNLMSSLYDVPEEEPKESPDDQLRRHGLEPENWP